MEITGVDIIIPIYNAYDVLVPCINSIRMWTDLEKHRLILVNDCSTDGRIMRFLDKMEGRNCIVIHNKQNHGFAANINIGIAQSQDRDVILLNSDTVVTKGWTDKLVNCAYSDPQIATVTPLSNNATICSVPFFHKENKLPDGYTADTYAELIERISLKKYPVIPLAHGFCMFIKRKIIRSIGGFDSETFQKGYGEENDFCFRAVVAGFHHVMCDDTFIMHVGTSSFTDEAKKKNIKEHDKILTERYPDLVHDVQVFLKDEPNYMVTHNIRMWMMFNDYKDRKTILYLIHADFRKDAKDHLGGTQLHVKDLAAGLSGQFNVVVAARNGDYLNLTFYADGREMFFQFHIGAKPRFEVLRSKDFARLYGRILDTFLVDCVHIHHVMGVSLELYYEAEKRKIPVFTTQHDFYYLCPNVKLLDERNHFCIDDESHDCKRCLKKQQGIADTIDYISNWKEQHIEALKISERIFVPSQSAGQIIQRYYPGIAGKLVTIGHGCEPMVRNGSVKEIRKKKRAFHVAFLGAINEAKGRNIIVDLVQKDRKVQWYLFGYFGMQFPELEKKNNFHNMGAYHREELPDLIAGQEIDLVCIFSIWPETFCYTLSEAVMARVPVLAFDIGALGERIRQMDNGWLLPYQTESDAVLEKIHSIWNDCDDYQRKKQNTEAIQLKTNVQMCGEYAEAYQAVLSGENQYQRGKVDYEWLLMGSLFLDGGEGCMELKGRLAEAERQLGEIADSFTYRAVLRLAGMPIPFRRQVKQVMMRIYRMWRK